MTRRGWWFAVAVAVQIAVLVGMTAVRSYTLATGARVMLRTVPVDPRDLFRGDYVRLAYEISTLDLGKVQAPPGEFRRGDTVWVVLQPGQPYHEAVQVSREQPAVSLPRVAVKARVEWHDPAPMPEPPRPVPEPPPGAEEPRPEPPRREFVGARLQLVYGIESFFVPEGQGKPLERPEVRLDVEAAVDRFGRAAIARVFLDGEEIRFE